MGVSSDGLLVYGIDLGDEKPEFLGSHDDMDEFLDEQSGLPTWGEDGHSFNAQSDYRDKCPADLTRYCSYDYPMHILAVRGTESRVSRGYVTEIETLSVDPEKVEAFKAWCADHGIEDAEPKWLLCSMYG
ncbi:hypothetical protein ACWIGM_09060 [Bosea sp. NPDC055332]